MRAALITGGAGGIGSAAARVLSAAGFRLILNYNSSEKAAKKLACEITAGGGVCDVVQADVSNPKDVEAMLKFTRSLCRVDTVVNNAGVSLVKLLQDVTDAEYRRVMDVNVTGTFNVTRAYLPDMISMKFGRIINLSSILGGSGGSMETVYSASKAAVDGFTRALAKEVGPCGITVNAVAPGLIDTEMNSTLTQSDKRGLIDSTPLSRIGKPVDVAEAIKFLAQDESFITGEIIKVTGGLII